MGTQWPLLKTKEFFEKLMQKQKQNPGEEIGTEFFPNTSLW